MFMLLTQNLGYRYRNGSLLHFPDLRCAAGEHWLLLGPSGSGKTTLLQLLAGLRTPTEGKVVLNDTMLSELKGAALDRFRGRQIGIIYQQPHFVRALNVGDNLALARQLAGLPADADRIQQLLDRLGVSHKIRSKTDQLSVGEQQRVAIARALVNAPGVILADEPTSALDDANANRVSQLLKEVAESVGAILVIVTHDARLREQFDRQVLLDATPV
jgi:putative ABC transport system ATP-binding protein